MYQFLRKSFHTGTLHRQFRFTVQNADQKKKKRPPTVEFTITLENGSVIIIGGHSHEESETCIELNRTVRETPEK